MTTLFDDGEKRVDKDDEGYKVYTRCIITILGVKLKNWLLIKTYPLDFDPFWDDNDRVKYFITESKDVNNSTT